MYASKAKELAALCQRAGGGRTIAARHILEEIERRDKEARGHDGKEDRHRP